MKSICILIVSLLFLSCGIYRYEEVKFEVYGDATEYRIQYGFEDHDYLFYNGEDATGDLNQDSSSLPWEFYTEKAASKHYLIVDNLDPGAGTLSVQVTRFSSIKYYEEISSGQRAEFQGDV